MEWNLFKTYFLLATGCGGEYFSSNGTIESPYYYQHHKRQYPPWSNCIWTVRTDRDKYISLSFVFLEIQVSERGDCSKDFVEIRDGADGFSPSLGIIWKFLPKQVLDIMHNYVDIISRLLCVYDWFFCWRDVWKHNKSTSPEKLTAQRKTQPRIL